MKIVTFGCPDAPAIMLLHGGGLNWWNYREAAELLAQTYNVLLPVLDGHAQSDDPFDSIERNAQRLLAWIDQNLNGRLRAIGGVSLGGQIAVEMLSQRPELCACALIESALVCPMPLVHALTAPAVSMSYGLIRQKWFARLQYAYLHIPQALFEEYYHDSSNISLASLTAMLQANSAYQLKSAWAQTGARVLIAAGSRETGAVKQSARKLHATLPGSTLMMLKGLRHGELSLTQPVRYASMMRELMEEKSKTRLRLL